MAAAAAAALIKYWGCMLAQAAMAAAAQALEIILAQQLPELMGLVVVAAVLAADRQVVAVQVSWFSLMPARSSLGQAEP